MKVFIPLSLVLLFWIGEAPAQSSAVEYMNKLSENYGQIRKDTWDYVKKASRGRNANKIEKRRRELLATLRSAKSDAGRLSAFEGDASLKEAVVRYFTYSIFVIDDDFKRIVDLEKIAEESYDDMEAYLLTKERVNFRMDSIQNLLSEAEKSFASAHNINLVKGEQSKVSKKLGNANEIMAYRNKLYLIFFKSSWYEQKMIEAMSAGKISDVEQYRQSLETVSKEGKDSLTRLPNFRGDRTLKAICAESLNFFLDEAANKMPNQVDFFLEKEKVETFKKNFDAKNKKKLTQEEVDEYNQTIEHYNQSITNFNKTNQLLNDRRSKVIKRWNKANTDFYGKHS